jgi:outer membrane protein
MNGMPTLLIHRFLNLTVFIFVLCMAPFTATADIRCATVNIDKVFKNYSKANEHKKALIAKREKYTQRLATLTSRRAKVSESMNELRNKIKREAKTEADKEIYRDQAQKLHDQYKSLSQAITELDNLQLKQVKENIRLLLHTSLSEIHTIVQQHAKDQQYDWIIDTSGRSSSTISPLIYARETEDITNDILKRINQ